MTDTINAALERKQADAAKFDTSADAGALALQGNQTWWTARQLGALRALGLEKTPDGDLMVFFHFCQKTGLDPFSKQIYLLDKRSKKEGQWVVNWVIVVGIDGFRVNAQRAADRRGITLEYEETVWYDHKSGKHEVWLGGEDGTELPAAAKVVVVKVMPDGTRLRIPGMAKFESYAGYGKNQKTGERYLMSQWGTMPDHMIEKCAEAFALRRAFANDLGGIYIEEEIQGEQIPRPPSHPADPPADVTAPGDAAPEQAADDAEGDADASDTPPAGDSTPPPVKESQALIAATFRQYGLGANTFTKLRHAIITRLMTPEGQMITDYIDLWSLTPEAVQAASDALVNHCDTLVAVHGDEDAVKDQLRAYGEQVIDQIAAAKVAH